MMNRLQRWWHAAMPSRESLENSRILQPVAHRIFLPALWRFTRRSVPRGTALGLFVGIFFLLPGVQMAGAALLALTFRANIPVAVGMTFLTNPATTPFLIAASIYIGNRLLGLDADVSRFMSLIQEHASIRAWCDWLFSAAAPALLAGLFLIAIVSAAVGYVLSAGMWRFWIARKWAAREHRHELAAQKSAG